MSKEFNSHHLQPPSQFFNPAEQENYILNCIDQSINELAHFLKKKIKFNNHMFFI
jgi:hypothetical protein